MSQDKDMPVQITDYSAIEAELEAVEHKMAGEIDPGARALVVAVAVLLLLLSLALPHTGSALGWDVLAGDNKALAESIALPSRIFVWFLLIFGVAFSALALITRRWVLAWIAAAGSAVASALGMLAIWTRQTLPDGHPGGGPGIGLILGWFVAIVLTFHWLRVVWSRTAVQLAMEEQRRSAAAEVEREAITIIRGTQSQ